MDSAATEPTGLAPELEELVSSQLICPISHRIMEYAVITPSGHTYDQAALLQWLRRRSVDPLSMEPLAASSLVPNRALHSEVIEQLEKLSAKGVADGDMQLADASMAKLESVRKAHASLLLSDQRHVGRLEWIGDQCVSYATWSRLLLQVPGEMWQCLLMLALALDLEAYNLMTERIRAPTFLLLKAVRAADTYEDTEARCARAREALPESVIVKCIRLLVVGRAPPLHWDMFSRLSLITLRYSFLLPVGGICTSIVLGGMASFGRFLQHCREADPQEAERASRNPRFVASSLYLRGGVALSVLIVSGRLVIDHYKDIATACRTLGLQGAFWSLSLPHWAM
ncbi:unnamed protein product [Prorocentrum cordatum]|uniref:U-box domain-containing protein n=1 Tax=Prorocentrum cordatum TaxID=2364126 RepID=A0ABN9RRX9_9DINO|nr:unnamed protein product [Polarella glacialis]